MAVWGTRSKRIGDARWRSLRNEKFVPCEDPNESERPFAFVRLADEGSVARVLSQPPLQSERLLPASERHSARWGLGSRP